MKAIKIINSGTEKFPFYKIMVDGTEYCSTDTMEKARSLKSLLARFFNLTDEMEISIEQNVELAIHHCMDALNDNEFHNDISASIGELQDNSGKGPDYQMQIVFTSNKELWVDKDAVRFTEAVKVSERPMSKGGQA